MLPLSKKSSMKFKPIVNTDRLVVVIHQGVPGVEGIKDQLEAIRTKLEAVGCKLRLATSLRQPVSRMLSELDYTDGGASGTNMVVFHASSLMNRSQEFSKRKPQAGIPTVSRS
jgi:hypothetical protein